MLVYIYILVGLVFTVFFMTLQTWVDEKFKLTNLIASVVFGAILAAAIALLSYIDKLPRC